MGVFALLNRLFHGPAWLTFLIMGVVERTWIRRADTSAVKSDSQVR